MKLQHFNVLFFIAIVLIILTWSAQSFADRAKLAYETQTLDLDTGVISDFLPGEPEGEKGGDIYVAYNADRVPHAVLMTASEGATLVFLSDASYDNVYAEDVLEDNFSADLVDKALKKKDTVMVKTDSGAIFKIGNLTEDETGVIFNYKQLK